MLQIKSLLTGSRGAESSLVCFSWSSSDQEVRPHIWWWSKARKKGVEKGVQGWNIYTTDSFGTGTKQSVRKSYFWQSRTDFNTRLKIFCENNFCIWYFCWRIYFFNDRLWDNPIYSRTILHNLIQRKAGPLPQSAKEDSQEFGFHGCWLVWFWGNHFTPFDGHSSFTPYSLLC